VQPQLVIHPGVFRDLQQSLVEVQAENDLLRLYHRDWHVLNRVLHLVREALAGDQVEPTEVLDLIERNLTPPPPPVRP